MIRRSAAGEMEAIERFVNGLANPMGVDRDRVLNGVHSGHSEDRYMAMTTRRMTAPRSPNSWHEAMCLLLVVAVLLTQDPDQFRLFDCDAGQQSQ